MLGHDFGGLRPWEMERLTPAEERAIVARYREIASAREVT